MTIHRLLSLVRAVCAAAFLASAIPAEAAVAMAPAPFANGSPELGKPLNEKSCVGCHAERFDGDADGQPPHHRQADREQAEHGDDHGDAGEEHGTASGVERPDRGPLRVRP